MTQIKICGITTPQALDAAVQNGARMVGFVFYPPSPRAISFDTAWNLARMVPTGVRSVGLFVDPDHDYLHHMTSGIPLDMIQLHGNETPARVRDIQSITSAPIIKAIPLADTSDLALVRHYEGIADWLLFDTKVSGETVHGGTGQTFDWNILKGRTFQKPWMLSGGLDAGNVCEAIITLQPTGVDVSSGVESARGVKCADKIKTFINAVQKSS